MVMDMIEARFLYLIGGVSIDGFSWIFLVKGVPLD
jgi:hypothetical protein